MRKLWLPPLVSRKERDKAFVSTTCQVVQNTLHNNSPSAPHVQQFTCPTTRPIQPEIIVSSTPHALMSCKVYDPAGTTFPVQPTRTPERNLKITQKNKFQPEKRVTIYLIEQ